MNDIVELRQELARARAKNRILRRRIKLKIAVNKSLVAQALHYHLLVNAVRAAVDFLHQLDGLHPAEELDRQVFQEADKTRVQGEFVEEYRRCPRPDCGSIDTFDDSKGGQCQRWCRTCGESYLWPDIQ